VVDEDAIELSADLQAGAGARRLAVRAILACQGAHLDIAVDQNAAFGVQLANGACLRLGVAKGQRCCVRSDADWTVYIDIAEAEGGVDVETGAGLGITALAAVLTGVSRYIDAAIDRDVASIAVALETGEPAGALRGEFRVGIRECVAKALGQGIRGD